MGKAFGKSLCGLSPSAPSPGRQIQVGYVRSQQSLLDANTRPSRAEGQQASGGTHGRRREPGRAQEEPVNNRNQFGSHFGISADGWEVWPGDSAATPVKMRGLCTYIGSVAGRAKSKGFGISCLGRATVRSCRNATSVGEEKETRRRVPGSEPLSVFLRRPCT